MRTLIANLPGARVMYHRLRKISLKSSRPFLNILLKMHGYTYNMWDLITNKNSSFITDGDFRSGFAAAKKQQDVPNFSPWTVHVNQWAAYQGLSVEGDFVECGVNTARLSMSNMVYTKFKTQKDRTYYLFDTFCGLDPQFSTDKEMKSYSGAYPDCYQFVVDSFKDHANVVIVKGAIPKTLANVNISKVAFLSIDMNCVAPEIAALEFFWPKMSPGAVVVLDDYNHKGHEMQKQAIDQFAQGVGAKVLPLPTGQGILVKGQSMKGQ